MTDDYHRPGRGGRMADEVEQPGCRRPVDAVLECNGWIFSERSCRELPRLPGSPCRRTQDMVRDAVGLAQPAPHNGRITAAARGKRTIVVGHVGPCGFGMAEHHERSLRACCHGHIVSGPMRHSTVRLEADLSGALAARELAAPGLVAWCADAAEGPAGNRGSTANGPCLEDGGRPGARSG
jgi:hypothetical protein